MINHLIIDAHVHTYPNAATGQQAMSGAGRSGYSGTIEELVSVMQEANLLYAVMANMTPTYDMRMAASKMLPAGIKDSESKKLEKEIDEKMIARMQRRNLWTCNTGKENDKLLPLITVDILQDSPEVEIERAVLEHGARGIKLHPVSNRFYPYDHRLWPAYKKAEEMRIPILFHSGGAEMAGYTNADYGRPKHFEQILRNFPKMNIVLAHLGNGFLEESILLSQNHDNAYFDTSGIISFSENEGGLTDKDMAELIRKIGSHKVLFGSDWPWFHPGPAIHRIRQFNLPEEEKR